MRRITTMDGAPAEAAQRDLHHVESRLPTMQPEPEIRHENVRFGFSDLNLLWLLFHGRDWTVIEFDLLSGSDLERFNQRSNCLFTDFESNHLLVVRVIGVVESQVMRMAF